MYILYGIYQDDSGIPVEMPVARFHSPEDATKYVNKSIKGYSKSQDGYIFYENSVLFSYNDLRLTTDEPMNIPINPTI